MTIYYHGISTISVRFRTPVRTPYFNILLINMVFGNGISLADSFVNIKIKM